MSMKITDLPVDALSSILASVAKLSDGATDMARSMSVCKRFLEAGQSNIVYKVVCFEKVEVLSRHCLFQKTDGLLYSCASAGNRFAQFLLAQVIIKSSSQLKHFGIRSSMLKNFRGFPFRYNTGRVQYQEIYLVASFMANFVPARGFRPFLPHWELFKIFLSNGNGIEILTMYRDIYMYVCYFTGRHIRNRTEILDFLIILPLMSVMVEPVREQALLEFDRTSRFFPGFVVPKDKKELSAP